jgi:hypothetical protein
MLSSPTGPEARHLAIRPTWRPSQKAIHALASCSYESHDYNESDRRSYAVKVISSARE